MDVIARDVEIGETLMMGLRLLQEGVGMERFRARFGEDLRERFAHEIGELQGAGLVGVLPDRIRLSVRGRLLANRVFVRFLPDA
jgi:oxygen-independent coproporphyrinogen-3 oxidase